jgi:hypothetical protein
LESSLTDFATVGNVPLRSSNLTTGINGIVQLLIEGLFDQRGKEVAMPVDPEFTTQMIRFNMTLYEKVKMLYFAPPIFHLMKHCIESSQKSMVFLHLIMLPVIENTGMHQSKFKNFNKKMEMHVKTNCDNQKIAVATHTNSVVDYVRNSDPLDDNSAFTTTVSEDDDYNSDDEFHIETNDNEVNNVSELMKAIELPKIDATIGLSEEELNSLSLFIIYEVHNLDKRQKSDSQFLQQINISTKRLMYDYRLLYYAYKLLKSRHPDIIESDNKLVQLVKHYFEDIISLCVEPFDQCIVAGKVWLS